MEFYQMLSKYYDVIFPLNKKTVELVSEMTAKGGKILDVGCATGQLIRALDNIGYDVTGLEYEPQLIGYSEKTISGDMHNLPFDNATYDTLVCTGNTLAHGSSVTDIANILSEFSRVLKTGGKALIQILNYDRILEKRPPQLSAIKTEDITFERHYEYEGDSIKFTGKLIGEDVQQASSVQLCPITYKEFISAVEGAGFKIESIYGGFDKSNFQIESSFPFIILLSNA
ncbi:MAG: hypothetical protein C0603_05920 [Denitrovibrio sp.]|nr:MAG: hypothetical protein C0603_05920 [Denitrovibrio sp.]